MKLFARGQQATIVHPEHAEIKVTIEKPPVSEMIEWQDTLKQYTPKPELAVHPVSGKVVKDASGRAVERPTRAEVPFSVTLDTMVKYVRNVEGFEDVKFSMEIARDVLRELFDSRLNWKADEDVPLTDDDGRPQRDEHGKPKTEKQEVTHNFYNYVLGKIFDPEIYGGPLESSSGSTATDATE